MATQTNWFDHLLRFIPEPLCQLFYTTLQLVISIVLKLIKVSKRTFNPTLSYNKLVLTQQLDRHWKIVKEIKEAETIAFDADHANCYYETSTSFFLSFLGPNLKYSCNLFLGDESLEQAEINMLELYCERAQLQDQMRILDAGCGWGSLSFYLCKKYPNAQVVAMTLSQEASNFMRQKREALKITNLTIKRCDLTKAQFRDDER